MSRSGRRNLLIVVLGLGLLAVGVDRLLLAPPGAAASTPSNDAAKVTAAVSGAASAASDATEGASGPEPLHVILAQRFERVGSALALEPERVPDAFAPGPVWLDVEAPVTVAASPRISSAEFMKRHGLQAIMVADGRDCAIVSGRLMHIGDELDGWMLWIIGKRVVTFRGGEDELALVLDRDE